MKKIIVALISLLILFCATGLCQAREHVVIKGECLSVIAKHYGQKLSAVIKANPEIKNPNLIFAGQRVVIPEGATAKKSSNKFYWVTAGLDPYGDKDPSAVINQFSVPDDVKSKWYAMIEKKEFVDYQIRNGKEFEMMAFGRKRVKLVSNVVASQKDKTVLWAAKKYSVVSEDGITYSLYEPLYCHNWAFDREKAEESRPPAAEQPEEIELPPPLLAEEDDDEEEPPAVVVKEVPPPVKKCQFNCRPDINITAGAFADWHLSGNQPRGWWLVGEAYFCGIQDGEYYHSFGFRAEMNDYWGKTGDDFHYYGDRYAFSPAYRIRTNNTETQFSAGYGVIKQRGHIEPNGAGNGEYSDNQKSEIITARISHEINRPGDVFHHILLSATGDLDITREKTAQWVNQWGNTKLDEKPQNNSMFNISADASVLRVHENVSLGLGASYTQYFDKMRAGFRLSPGLDFYAKNLLVGAVRANPTLWTDGDHSIGIGGYVNASNLVVAGYRWLISDKKPAPPDIDPEKLEKLFD